MALKQILSIILKTNLVREQDPKAIVDTYFPHLTSEVVCKRTSKGNKLESSSNVHRLRLHSKDEIKEKVDSASGKGVVDLAPVSSPAPHAKSTATKYQIALTT
ncbi:hypothetical protein MUK42_15591, partial [Musa troglodytarum]